MKKLNWLFLFVLSFAFLGCEDDEDVTLDTMNPTITITSPSMGQSFNGGDVVELRAMVKDNLGLDEIRVFVTDPSNVRRQVDDKNITDILNDSREKNLEVDIMLEQQTAAGAYMITIEADDDAGNKASQTVNVNVK